MKRYTILLLISVVGMSQLFGQYAWKYRDSEGVARDLVKKKDMVTKTHAIYEKHVRISFEWDDDEDKPIVVEEGFVSVVALIGGLRYYGSFFQSPNEEITEIVGYTENDRRYSIPKYTRTYEDEAIFSQDGEYVGYSLPSGAFFGEITKFGYTKVYRDIKFFTNTFFRDYEYVVNGHLEVWIPDWMDTEVIEYHIKGNGIKKSKDKKVEWKPTKDQEFGSLDADYKYTVYNYDYQDMEGFKDEAMAPGATHYLPHLLFLNKSYNRNSDRERLFKDAGDLYKWYSGLVEELEEEPSKELTKIADSLTQNLTTDLDKVKAVFYWVQNNIRYIAFEDGIAGFKPEEASNVCSYRYGDCKGMANLTKAMLVHLGFDARLTWMGTTHIHYSYDQPTLSADNHMICTVIIDNEKLFLDPTESYVAIGDYAYRIQGREVLIEDGDSFLREKIPLFGPEKNKQTYQVTASVVNGKLVGSVNRQYQGESKKIILASYANVRNQNKDDALKIFLSGANKNVKITKVSSSDFEDRESDFTINYQYELSNNVITLEDRMMLQLDWERDLYYYDIDRKRQAPLEFFSRKCMLTEVKFVIPHGYSVAELPDNITVEREGYTFEVNYEEQGGRIIMTKKLLIADTMIDKTQFKQWNADIAELRASYDSYVILQKN